MNDSGSRSQFLGRDLLPYTTRSEPQGRVQNKRILLLHKEGRVGLVHFLKCEAAFYIDRNLLMARAAPCIVSLAPCFSGYDKSFEGEGPNTVRKSPIYLDGIMRVYVHAEI